MSQSHSIKGGTTNKALQEQCFLWERGDSVGVDFDLLNFNRVMQKNVYKTQKESQKQGFLYMLF